MVRSSVVTVVALAVGGLAFGCSEDTSEQGRDESGLKIVSARFQVHQSFDYESLESSKETLLSVGVRSALAGYGEVVDLRLAYSERLSPGDELTSQQMVLVVEPETVTKGEKILGSSGEVLVEVAAPPTVDGALDVEAIELLRREAVDSAGGLAFFLDRSPPLDRETVIDEFEGRSEDDPLFTPSHPSSLLGVVDGEAFPMLTDEKIAAVPENFEALRSLGVEVERFGIAPMRDVDPAVP